VLLSRTPAGEKKIMASRVKPVTRLGLLGPAQPKKIYKNKKNRKVKKVEKNKKCVCMNKNNVNLLVYSLTPKSGIKISV